MRKNLDTSHTQNQPLVTTCLTLKGLEVFSLKSHTKAIISNALRKINKINMSTIRGTDGRNYIPLELIHPKSLQKIQKYPLKIDIMDPTQVSKNSTGAYCPFVVKFQFQSTFQQFNHMVSKMTQFYTTPQISNKIDL